MGDLYPYASGDLIDQPNTYFYTEFSGQPFVEAWRRARQDVLSTLPPPAPPPPAANEPRQSQDSLDLLERAFAGDMELRETFRRKFEITKRVHGGYDDQFRALNRQDRKNLAPYLRAADVFELTYSHFSALRYLNVLHKCLDTLCAHRDQLDPPLASRLAWHLAREQTHFDQLVARVMGPYGA